MDLKNSLTNNKKSSNFIRSSIFKLRRLLSILNPQPIIAGLAISDTDLKFLSLEGNKMVSASVKLPAGVITEGKIKEREGFKSALLNLRSQISRRKNKKLYVIINVPDINIYAQVFNLPMAAANNLEEAVGLNLKMISPSDFSTVYADWQKVGETSIDGGQLEILAAFISRQIIDEIINCLKETNFVVVAVEFSALALSRLVQGLGNIAESCLLIFLDSAGLSFVLIKNHNLYFNHFVAWPIEKNRQISWDFLREIVLSETQKVLNFSEGHWPGQLKNFLLVTPALEKKISQILTENFSMPVQKISLPTKLAVDDEWSITNSQLPSLSNGWFSVLGSTLRGLIPRSKDIIISLASIGTEQEFRQHQLIGFSKLWRNIILTTFSFITLCFIGLNVFLTETADSLQKRLTAFVRPPEIEEINKLQNEAKRFNSMVEVALQSEKEIIDWVSFLEKIGNLAGTEIFVDRIFIQSLDMPVLFNGRAVSENNILNFKSSLEAEPGFQGVELPLASISAPTDGLFKFSINFKIDPAVFQTQ